jgi:quinolinate synthase
MTVVEQLEIAQEIKRLKAEKNAVILAHNYQLPEVQDIADFIGDSLGLSQAAAKTDADIIVFCGVHFMAETASIICPEKRVLLPDLEAGCSLAATINAEQLRQWKSEHPNAVVVAYVNTTAEVKAESDYCCTSTNALKVIQAIPPDREILFLPDMFLGAYLQKVTGRKMHIWPGSATCTRGFAPETSRRCAPPTPKRICSSTRSAAVRLRACTIKRQGPSRARCIFSQQRAWSSTPKRARRANLSSLQKLGSCIGCARKPQGRRSIPSTSGRSASI